MPLLTGFLILVCVWLWTFARPDRQQTAMLNRTGHAQLERSPMDMPAWYRKPLQHGARYIEIGPMRLAKEPPNQKHHKTSAVRGYW